MSVASQPKIRLLLSLTTAFFPSFEPGRAKDHSKQADGGGGEAEVGK